MVRVAQPEDFKSFLSPDRFWCLFGGCFSSCLIRFHQVLRRHYFCWFGQGIQRIIEFESLRQNKIVISFNWEPQLLSRIVLYRLLIMEHLTTTKQFHLSLALRLCQSCTFFSAEDQLFAESFLPNLSSWQLLQRHVTGLVAGPSICWALELKGWIGEVDRLMVKVSLSHQVTFTFFFAAEFLLYCHTWSPTPFHFCIQNATPSSKPSNQSFYANLL